jgi:hypothetical protein
MYLDRARVWLPRANFFHLELLPRAGVDMEMQFSMSRTGVALVLAIALCLPRASSAGQQSEYRELRQQIARDGGEMRQRFRAGRQPRGRRFADLERRLLRRFDQLFASWLGSRWGLGLPQSTIPKVGKTNCGLFVAVVLRDAGFRLPIWKFNRQTAYHGTRSLAPRRLIRFLHRKSMKGFISAVRRMGPGLYLIGLDFHTGFLRVHDDGRVRFVHASYVTRTVVDEPAETAIPIVSARYARMVGKILQPNMLRSWLKRRPIKILGNR